VLIPVSNISVSCDPYIDIGGTATCIITTTPSNKGFTLSSSDTSIATVQRRSIFFNNEWTVTGVAAGSVTIRATATDGSEIYGTSSITVLTIHPNLTSICSSSLIFSACDSLSPVGSTWRFSCVFPLHNLIYGKSRCSTQSGTFAVGITGTPAGADNSGPYCWCQLCSDSDRTLCGAWVYNYAYMATANCTSDCAHNCGSYAGNIINKYNDNALKRALCVAP